MHNINAKALLGIIGVIGASTFVLGWVLSERVLILLSALFWLLDALGLIQHSTKLVERVNTWSKVQSTKGNDRIHTRILKNMRCRILERRLKKLDKEVSKYVADQHALKEETFRRCHLLVMSLGLTGVFGLMATMLQFVVRPTEASTQGLRAIITWLNGVTYLWMLLGAFEGYLLWRLHSRVNSYHADKKRWLAEKTILESL